MDGNPDSTATVTVIVDSTSSLTADHIRGLPIEVVPLQLSVGSRHYLDGVDIEPEEFYRQIMDETVPAHDGGSHPPLRTMQRSSAPLLPAGTCFASRQPRS